MGCRRAYISRIDVNLTEPKTETNVIKGMTTDPGITKKTTTETTTTPPTEVTKTVFKDNITKRVLRQLLSECDYFEMIKENEPMVYQTFKDKIKHKIPDGDILLHCGDFSNHGSINDVKNGAFYRLYGYEYEETGKTQVYSSAQTPILMVLGKDTKKGLIHCIKINNLPCIYC